MGEFSQRGVKDVEAATILGLHPQTLRNMRCRGEGPPYYVAGKRAVRYLLSDLEAYRTKRRVEPERVA
jgi:hypothetical protein